MKTSQMLLLAASFFAGAAAFGCSVLSTIAAQGHPQATLVLTATAVGIVTAVGLGFAVAAISAEKREMAAITAH